MMDTILNLGLNDATTDGPGRGRPATRRSRRPAAPASETMFRVDRRRRAPCPTTRGSSCGCAIEAVFRSWNSDRAIAYRRREGIPDDLGTAVTVQAMVFGNRGADSATGVAFTRNPATGRARAVRRRPVRRAGRGRRRRHAPDGAHRASSTTRLPDGRARSLRDAGTRLEHHLRDLCDIEFTIEQGRLWLLQVRVGKRSPQAALRIAVDMAEDPAFPLSRARGGRTRRRRSSSIRRRVTTGRSGYVLPLLTGLGASPGVASGRDRDRRPTPRWRPPRPAGA